MDDEIEHDGAVEAAADDTPFEVYAEDGGEADSGFGETAADVVAPDTRRRNAQTRIDAVTRARREAERERDYWRARAAGGEDSDAQPERGDFAAASRSAQRSGDDAADLDDADLGRGDEALDPRQLIDQVRAQARAELLAEAAAYEAQEQAGQTVRAWRDRQAAFAAERPDYVDAVLGSAWACSETMADALQDSEAGPALAYHLSRNPGEAAAIAALSPLAQVRVLGRLEAGLMDSGGEPALSISQAPAPPPALRGAGGKFRPAPDTDDFAAFERAYGTR